MKNPSNKLITLLLLFVMVIAGCAQPDMQDEIKTVLPEKKAPVVATIWLPDTKTPNTRTILPGTLETPASYKVTLDYEKSEGSIVPEIVVSPGKIDITNVKPGKYSLKVDGLNAAGKVIVSGTNSTGELFEIVDDQIKEITINLYAVKNASETGAISVTFNWNNILTKMPTNPTEEDLAKLGPISNAIHDGYLKFELFTYNEENGTYESHSTNEWNMQDKTWDEIKAVNSFTTNFTDVKADDVFVNFSILNKSGDVLLSHVFNEVAKVYVGQTSYYEGDLANEFKLNKVDDVYSYNIRNLEVGYPLNAEKEDKEFVITWSEPCDFKSVELQLWINGAISGTPIAITNPSLKTATVGVQPNTDYYITSKAISTDNTTSNVKIWKRADGSFFRAKEKISSIEYTGEAPTAVMKSGDSFELTATITPETATYQNLTWEPTVPDTLYITNSTAIGSSVNVRANKPGITGIMVKNDDPFNGWAKETGHKIEIKLATPVGLTSGTYYDEQGQLRGTTINWNPVAYAENYKLYRRVNADGEFHLVATTENGETTYNDLNVEYGKSYEYQVEAIAPELEATIKAEHPEYKGATSEKSAISEKVTLPTPHINMQIIEVEQKTFELTDNTDTGSAVYTHEGKQLIQLGPDEERTIKLTKEIPGMTTYTWYVNGKHPQPNLTGDFKTAGSFTISNVVDYIKMNTPAPQELMLVASNDTDSYNITVQFTVIQESVKGVEWDAAKKPAARISAADSIGNRTIYAKVTNENATMQDIYYELASDSDPSIASIDRESGVITVLKGGIAKFVAYSAENKNIKTTEPITLEFYVPTIKSPENLLGAVNLVLQKHIDDASKTFLASMGSDYVGDWWEPNLEQTTWNGDKVSITNNKGPRQSCDGGGITYSGHKATLGEIGIATFTTNTPIAVWAVDDGLNTYKDPLERIGFHDSNFNPANELKIELPENQGTATVKIDNVYVLESKINSLPTGATGGTYTITFSHDILTESGLLIKAGAQNPVVINAKDALNRIKVK